MINIFQKMDIAVKSNLKWIFFLKPGEQEHLQMMGRMGHQF